MVMVVAAAFAFSWTPYFLVSMVTQFGSNYLEKQNYFFTMLSINLLAFLNSCVNPFIYAAMSSRFRAGFRRILHPGFCRCGSPWIKAPRPVNPWPVPPLHGSQNTQPSRSPRHALVVPLSLWYNGVHVKAVLSLAQG